MTSAVIVSTARTPLTKSWKGAFNMTHGATMGGHVVEHAIKRAGIEAGEVDDVIMGCGTPEGATGANIARQIALRAGCPVSVSGMTINRFALPACKPLLRRRSVSWPTKAIFTWPVAWRLFPVPRRK